MRKILIMFTMCFTLLGSVYAQVLVTGKVTDEEGIGIPGVSVVEKGTNNGTVTNFDGAYTLNIAGDGTIVFSFIGMKMIEEPVNNRSTINVTMRTDAVGIDEVVVTALGIEREKKSLGYAMQEIGGVDLVDAREPNLANTLSGKVSGLQIVRGAGGPAGSSKIILRGFNSLTGSNQPLVVVDGMPIDNFTDGAKVDMWGSGEGRDFGSGIGDLNPDDIESMSVLKGASAAALYGSRAGNGVILITTKKGRKTKGAGITINSRVGFESLLTQPDLQDVFAQGSYGNYDRLASNSWGPKVEGQLVEDWQGNQSPLRIYDNVENFHRTGIVSNQNVSYQQLINKTSVFASITRYDNKSPIPDTHIDRSTFTFRATSEFGENDKWKFDTKATYIKANAENRPLTGIAQPRNTFETMWLLPRNININDFNPSIDGDGNQIWWPEPGSSSQNNPWWNLQYGKNLDTRDRMLGYMSLAYDFTDWLSAEIKAGTDYFTTKKEQKIHTGGNATPEGSYSKDIDERFENNYNFLIKARKDELVDRLGGNLNLGGNIMHRKNQGLSGNAGLLVVPNLFSLNNGQDKPSLSQRFSERKTNSLFGSATLSWDGYLFLEGTLRNDWSSTLHEDNRSFLYSSINLSAIVTDMITKNGGSLPDWFTFAKVRASYAEVGNDLEPYQLYNTYDIGKSNSPHEQTTATPGTVLFDPNVKNELQESIEVGLDLRFVDNRFGIDFTYYKTNTTNQLFDLPLDPFSGYRAKKVNAGNIQNEGFEIMLNADIFRSREGFNWTVNANMSKNENTILELADGVEEYVLDEVDDLRTIAFAGGFYGEIHGKKMLRVDDETSPYFGRVIVDESGLPLKGNDWEYLGNQQPDWMLGVTNMFSYKNLSLSVLLDAKFGGKIFSGSLVKTHVRGVAAQTVVNGERNEFVVDGVVETAEGTYVENTEPVLPQDYWVRVAGTGNLGMTDEFTYDATSVRIRNIKLGYRLPSRWFDNIPINGVDVSVIGNNVWLIHSNVPGIDPESVIGVATNAIGMEIGSPPTMKSYTFSLSLKF